MSEPKVLILTGSLSGQISGGMGVAATEIAKHLSAITPVQLIKSGNENIPVKNTHIINASSPAKQIISYSIFPSDNKETIHYDFLISPYRTDDHYKSKQITNSGDSVLEVIETIAPTYLEEVAFYNQKIIELAQTLAFDIIYCHDWTTFQAGISLKLHTGKKLILHIHSLETDRKPDNKNANIYYLERKAMDYADAVITVSQYTKALICKNYEIYPGKINVVYNALKQGTENREQGTGNRALNVLFMGRLTRQKGIDTFMNIAELIHEDFPEVQFVIAGEGELRTEIEDRIESSIAVDNISLLGYLNSEEKNNLLAISDIFCMPSESEPFGLSALEAAAAGIPCVISKQSGISEVLQSALKVDFDDLPGFVIAISSLLESESLRKTISSEQLSEIKALSWEKTTEAIKDIMAGV
ncbi:MAG TPA: glycosyltransferase family 4 protein [Cytophagaceae bacterium]|nr:glycosyltransferase family 4 protein [Cytophagaceae bacterium]